MLRACAFWLMSPIQNSSSVKTKSKQKLQHSATIIHKMNQCCDILQKAQTNLRVDIFLSMSFLFVWCCRWSERSKYLLVLQRFGLVCLIINTVWTKMWEKPQVVSGFSYMSFFPNSSTNQFDCIYTVMLTYWIIQQKLVDIIQLEQHT